MANKPWVDKLRNPPIQYEKGWTEFYKLKFKLTPDVLIPRPETELLVDEVLSITRLLDGSTLENEKTSKRVTRVVDVGTGSGCIAISIAKNTDSTKIFALDISEEALKVAELNAKFHRTENKVIFMKSDLLSIFLRPPAGRSETQPPSDTPTSDSSDSPSIDIIVANLPYIPSARLMLIDPMVRDFEPKLALDGGSDGFELYRQLFQQIIQLGVGKQGQLGVGSVQLGVGSVKYLLAEIDEEQGDVARAEAKKYFPEAETEIKRDLAKKDRILKIKF